MEVKEQKQEVSEELVEENEIKELEINLLAKVGGGRAVLHLD